MLCLFAHLIHDVIDGNLADKAVDFVHDRDGDKVVLLDEHCDFINGRVYIYAHYLGVHHMLYLGNRGACNHLCEREKTA